MWVKSNTNTFSMHRERRSISKHGDTENPQQKSGKKYTNLAKEKKMLSMHHDSYCTAQSCSNSNNIWPASKSSCTYAHETLMVRLQTGEMPAHKVGECWRASNVTDWTTLYHTETVSHWGYQNSTHKLHNICRGVTVKDRLFVVTFYYAFLRP